MDLIDESGEIRATAFKEQVDALYDKMQVGKVYIIRNAKFKTGNPKFNHLKNDYEMTFTEATEVVEDTDTSSVPMQKVRDQLYFLRFGLRGVQGEHAS